jgi:hypothetical protein
MQTGVFLMKQCEHLSSRGRKKIESLLSCKERIWRLIDGRGVAALKKGY